MTPRPPVSRPRRLGVALALLALVAQWLLVGASAAHQARWLAGTPWAAVCTTSAGGTERATAGAIAPAVDACAVCAAAALPLALAVATVHTGAAHAAAAAPRRHAAAAPRADAALRPPVRAPPRG